MHRILLCTDGECRSAEEYAVSLAHSTGAELVVLHVVDTRLLSRTVSHEVFAYGRQEYLSYVSGELEREGREVLERVRRRAEELGVRVRCVLRRGSPAEEVLREVEAGGYWMVVLGRGRRGFLASLRSDRVAEKVLARAEAPVMLV